MRRIRCSALDAVSEQLLKREDVLIATDTATLDAHLGINEESRYDMT